MNFTSAARQVNRITRWSWNFVPGSFPALFGSWLVCLVSMGSLGCGNSSHHPNLGRVSGTITIDGRPLALASISFRSIGGGRSSTATSDAQGHYELIYLVYPDLVKGARLGLNTVHVSTYQGSNGLLKKARPELVPYCYRKKDSILKVFVKKGHNNIDLKLKTDCGKAPAEFSDEDLDESPST